MTARPRKRPTTPDARRRAAAVRVALVVAGTIVAVLLGGQFLQAAPAQGALAIASAIAATPSPDASASLDPTGTSEPTSSVDPTGSPAPTSSVEPTRSVTPTPSTEPTASRPATPTPVFATVAKCNLHIHLPAPLAKVIAVGFHQADNKKAYRFVPSSSCHPIGTRAAIRKWLASSHTHLLFQQPLRGRGSSNLSAADCAVPRETTVVAPVTGRVTSVKKYKLSGRIDDVRLEFMPTTATGTRVVMLHIKDIKVHVGDRVVGGVTPVARVRNLKLDSTVNHYFSARNADHVHIQVNDKTYKSPIS
jgi:hypothetical protein